MHLLTFKHPINDVHDTLKLRQYASLRTPMKYVKKATLVKKKIIWRKNPKHAKIIIFRIT